MRRLSEKVFPIFVSHQGCDFRDLGAGCMRSLSEQVSPIFSCTPRLLFRNYIVDVQVA